MSDQVPPFEPDNPGSNQPFEDVPMLSISSPTDFFANPIPSDPMDLDITPAPLHSIPHPVTDIIYTPPPRQVGINDLPNVILTHILSFLAIKGYRGYDTNVPCSLLPVSAVSRRFRLLVAGICSHLTFHGASAPQQMVGWIRLASPRLKSFRFLRALNGHSEDEEHEEDELSLVANAFSCNIIFRMLTCYAPRLQELNLLGVKRMDELDSRLLENLLKKVRGTLTKLTLVDIDDFSYIRRAVVNARLHRLVDFQLTDLEPECGPEVHSILASFLSTGLGCQPPLSALRTVYLTLNPSMDINFLEDSFQHVLCPSVARLYYVSVSRVFTPVSYELIECFPGLELLHLEHSIFYPEHLSALLPSLTKLEDLRLQDCEMIEERPLDENIPSTELLQLFQASAEVLTVLRMPRRCFNALELDALAYHTPPLKELGLVVGPNAAKSFRFLCMKVRRSLTAIGIYGQRSEEARNISPEDQREIVMALGSLQQLSRIESWFLALSTASWEKIMMRAGRGLIDFAVGTSPRDCSKAQTRCLLMLIRRAAKHNKNLRFFHIDSDKYARITASSRLGQMYIRLMLGLHRAAPLICISDLNEMLRKWLSGDIKLR